MKIWKTSLLTTTHTTTQFFDNSMLIERTSKFILALDSTVIVGGLIFGILGIFWQPLKIMAFGSLSTKQITKFNDIDLYSLKEELFAMDVKALGEMSNYSNIKCDQVRNVISDIRRSIFFNKQHRLEYENLWYATQFNQITVHKCEDLANNLKKLGLSGKVEYKPGETRTLQELVREFNNKIAN